jgi:hypothetical protein
MLARNGFKTLGQYDMYGEKFIEDKSINILTIASKSLPNSVNLRKRF